MSGRKNRKRNKVNDQLVILRAGGGALTGGSIAICGTVDEVELRLILRRSLTQPPREARFGCVLEPEDVECELGVSRGRCGGGSL